MAQRITITTRKKQDLKKSPPSYTESTPTEDNPDHTNIATRTTSKKK